MNLKRLNVIITILLLVYPLMAGKSNAEVLPAVNLSGENGGLCGGSEWKSSSLKGKVNLLLYVDPDKQSWVKPLVTKLDSVRFVPDSLGITFVLNTDATIIPDFLIRNRLQKKAQASPDIVYVLDRTKMLVRKWKLKDDNINVLLLDASGNIIQKHYGQISQEFINQFINKINQSIKQGDLK